MNTLIIFGLLGGFGAHAVPKFDFTPSDEPNMNGDYIFMTEDGSKPNDLFPKQFKDYPGGVEYYDVYSPPMETLYSQLYYQPLEPVDLPKEMVDKYAGKGKICIAFNNLNISYPLACNNVFKL